MATDFQEATGAWSFASTRWTVIDACGQEGSAAQEAFSQLCRTYWFPLYAYVRRHGHSSHDAQDLTQDFFLHLISRQTVTRADRSRGRFRSFLLAALQNFLHDAYDRRQAQRRGGGQKFVFLDDAAGPAEDKYLAQAAQPVASAETFYDVQWARTLVQHTLAAIRAQVLGRPRGEELWTCLHPFLLEDDGAARYEEVAARLKLSAGAVKTAVHRLRRLYRQTLREEVSRTVSTEEEVDAELRHLCAVLATQPG